MIAPILEEIDKENSEICVCKVNVDENGELAGAFGVQYIPYLVVIKDGAITHQSSGVKAKEQNLDLSGLKKEQNQQQIKEIFYLFSFDF